MLIFAPAAWSAQSPLQISTSLGAENWLDSLTEALIKQGVSDSLAVPLATAIGLLGVLIIALLVTLLAKAGLVRAVHKLIKKTRYKWDDALVKWRVLERLSHLAPAAVIYLLTPHVLREYPFVAILFMRGAIVYMVLAGVLAVDSALNAFGEIYRTFKVSREIPIRSFLQVLKIVLYSVGGIIAIAVIIGKTPGYLLSGIGAMTAILMLIFKDAILGLVAGIQLSGNKMLASGDWIEMPKYGADGDVLEVSLTTVKVQNWDKTITTIPTYALISDSFKNWRGMTNAGGRRIKRSLSIDLQTIRFCTEQMLERYQKIEFIRSYLDGKISELKEHNSARAANLEVLANGRRLTNVGTFRAYIQAYLKNHPMINLEMTFLVRQLPPGPEGLPIEIYVFSKDKAWANYEAIQADIFDHLLAVAPEFDLRVYQNPTGNDFRAISGKERIL